jgi:FKBP-type peptidyl-prolyl cis-trans isomerase FklB
MKKTILFTALAALTMTSSLMAQTQTQKPKMDTLSNSLGILIAQNLIRQGLETVDAASLAKGIETGLKLAPADAEKIIEKANDVVTNAMKALQSKKFEKTIMEGKAFLASNGKRAGVVTLPSGLQYEILTPGTGPKPKATDKVTVHYHGTLLDGTVFDSSVERGQPATFGVNQVIPGWVEGLQLMPQGSKWKLFIPSDLAYGERGAGNDIGPYSTLVFEVELIKIN